MSTLGTDLRRLLLTWPLRQARGEIHLSPADDKSGPNWEWQLERRYGSGDLEYRAALLEEILRHARTRRPAYLVGLKRAKSAVLQMASDEDRVSRARVEAQEAQTIRRNLMHWLTRAIDFHRRANPDGLRKTRRSARRYEHALESLEADLLLTIREPPPPRARRNPRTYAARLAKDVLREAGVRRDDIPDLLRAIGVLPLGRVT